MRKANRTKPVKVNKFSILLLAVSASVIGYTPVALLMERPIILVYIIVWVSLSSFINIRKFTSRATIVPNLGEFLMGGLESIYMPAFIGVIWMVIYGASFGILQLVQLLVKLFSNQLIINVGQTASYPVFIFGGIFTAITSTYSTDEVSKKLYPNVAGIRSEYFNFFNKNRSRFIGGAIGSFIVLLIAVGLLTFNVLNQYLIYILLQLTFFIVGSLFISETRVEKANKRIGVDVVERIKMLLETAGYITQISPRTDDASIDPLLTNLDIFAQRKNHNLLLEIKLPVSTNRIVDWKSASALIQSAYLLSVERGINSKDMDTRLVLIDMKPDPSLKKISKRDNIQLLNFSSKQIDEVLRISNLEEQKLAVRSLLKLPAEDTPFDYLSS